LIFLYTNSEEFNNHQITLNLRSLFDYAPLLVSIIIKEKFVPEKKQIIVKNSEEEKEFVKELKVQIGNKYMNNILDSDSLAYLT